MKAQKKLFLLALFALNYSIAQDKPSSPEGYLARAAGTYLGAHEYIYRLRESECGFAVSKVPKPYEQTIDEEIIPAFKPQFRAEAKNLFLAQKNTIKKSSEDYVNSLVATALKEQKQDKKVVCGTLFGAIAGTAGQAKQNWLNVVDKYGVSSNK
jgi:hypothetical protein